MRSGNKGDTIDFLERCFAFSHRIKCRLAQEPGAVFAGGLPELTHGSAACYQLANLVVQDQELRDRLAATVARSAAFAATASGAEAECPRRFFSQARFL